MTDDLLRRDLAAILAQWREEASQMPRADAAVRHRTLMMAAELTAVLEEAEPASPGSGVVTRRATRLALVNAIRGQQVMVSLTGPPADLEVAAWLADLILAQLPEGEPASLNSAEFVTAAAYEACAAEIRRKADDYESWVDPDPAFQRAHIAGMREAARFILAGENPPCVSADVQDGIAAEEARIP
jgi:hypothetical protein